jgi:hypothetical protein
MALQIRKGTNAERTTIVPASGELIYTTDTKGLYIGDGTTTGGIVVNSGNSVSGVSQIIAGSGVSITPTGGTGAVTINASASGTAIGTGWARPANIAVGDIMFGHAGPAALDAGDILTVSSTNQIVVRADGGDGIAYGNGKFICVGKGVDGAYSTDGVTWTSITMPVNANWTQLTYGGTKWVAIGNIIDQYGSSVAAYSTDGITWSSATLPNSGNFAVTQLSYGGGKFVALCLSNTAIYSTDGITWTSTATLPSYVAYWNAMAYGAGIFVASRDISTNNAYWSADGITWSAITLPGTDTNLLYISFVNNKFIANSRTSVNGVSVYNTAISTDGKSWTLYSSSVKNFVFSIEYGASKYVLNSSGDIYTSTDAITWTYAADTNGSRMAFGNSKFVVFSDTGYYYVSTDGTNWTTTTTSSLLICSTTTTGNNRYAPPGSYKLLGASGYWNGDKFGMWVRTA